MEHRAAGALIVSPLEPIAPVVQDPWSGVPFVIGLLSGVGAAIARWGPSMLDALLRLSAEYREHKRLRAPSADAAAEEPPAQPEPAAGRRPATGRASIPDDGVSRAEFDARFEHLRAEREARFADFRAELLREVTEAKAETAKLAEKLDRLARAFDRLKVTVLRGIKEFAERLAKLEGWLDGWINSGGPGSRRR